MKKVQIQSCCLDEEGTNAELLRGQMGRRGGAGGRQV